MMRQFELVERVKAYAPEADEDLLNRAYVFGVKAHGNQKRDSGDAYFSHREMEEPPSCPPALRLFQSVVAMDDGARRANQRRLRELALGHAGEVTVHSAHCPVEFDRLAAAP